MNTTLRILSLVGKITGVLVTLDWGAINPKYGPLIFFVASILKDVVNRVGDWMDNGKLDDSFRYTLKIFVLVFACCTLFGCASILPGHDPVVVRAEQSAAIAVNAFDAFFQFEYVNRENLPPKVTEIANELRRTGPRAIESLRAATKAYKQNRNAESKATLATAQAVLDVAVQEAQHWLAQQSKRP